MQKFISSFLSLLMVVLQMFGINVSFPDEKFIPEAVVSNVLTNRESNPEIVISLNNTSFNPNIGNDDIHLSGALRGLEIVSVNNTDKTTLSVKTDGKIDADIGNNIGYVVLSENAAKCKTELVAETEISISKVEIPIVHAGTSPQMLIKSLIYMGVGCSHKELGPIAACALDPILADLFGLNDTKEDEIIKKLDALTADVKDIKLSLEKNTQDILAAMYVQNNFGSFDTQLNSLKTAVIEAYSQIKDIENSDGSDYYKSLKVAELLSFKPDSTTNIFNITRTLASYLTADNISFDGAEGLYTLAFRAACHTSTLGGEAAIKASPYINEVNELLCKAYDLMAIVLCQKLYIGENPDEYIQAAPDSQLGRAFAAAGGAAVYMDSANRTTWSRLLNGNDNSLAAEQNKIFNEKNPESVVSQYNNMIMNHWFTYIRNADYKNGVSEIEFVYINNKLNVTDPTECGLKRNASYSSFKGMMDGTNKNLNDKIHFVFSKEELEKIITALRSALINTDPSATFSKLLSDYGFIFPENISDPYLVTDASSTYDSWVNVNRFGDVTSKNCSGTLSFTGYKCEKSVRTSVPETVKYFDGSSSSVNGTSESVGSKEYSLLYFSPAPVQINDNDSFIAFISNIANGKTYKNMVVSLNTDIDLKTDEYIDIWPQDKDTSAFCGTFNGNGFKISSLADAPTNHHGGLFRTLGDGATVMNLKLEKPVINANGTSSGHAALAGCITGNVIINNVEVSGGEVEGYNDVGSIVGLISGGSAVISNCSNSAKITALNSHAGGITGYSSASKPQYISSCKNSGTVYANSGSAGGIAGCLSGNSDTSHNISGCENSADITVSCRAGGIVGHLATDSHNHTVYGNHNYGSITVSANCASGGIIGFMEGGGKFESNTNEGSVYSERYSGGIAGEIEDDPCVFTDCSNSGVITAISNAGGIAGYGGNADKDRPYTFTGCKNSGNVTSETNHAGGIAGSVSTDSLSHSASYCTNTADIKGARSSAGIIGWMEGGGSFSMNTNSGSVISTDSDAAGIIGAIEDDACTFGNETNTGNINGHLRAGGIVGEAGDNDHDKAFTFTNCTNKGYIVSETSDAGGIAGGICSDNGGHIASGNSNYGTVKGYSRTGGIIGWMEGGGTFSDNINCGDIIGINSTGGGIIGSIEDDESHFTRCANIASVSAKLQAGGTVGYIGSKSQDKKFTFTECFNNGEITSYENEAGGIIGVLKTDSTKHLIDKCENSGNITGLKASGGIIGYMYGGGTLSSNVSSASITSISENAGGIIGRIEDDTCNFTDCVSRGNISGALHSGTVCGWDGKRGKVL